MHFYAYVTFIVKSLNLSLLLLLFFQICDSSYICSYILGRSSLFPIDDGLLDDGHNDQVGVLNSPTCYSAHQNGERIERFSRKVFVGGLPPDIDEGKLMIWCYSLSQLIDYSMY